MDLNKLKWIKNVNAAEGDWVYIHQDVSYPYLVPEFYLHWKTTALENAQKPSPGDLILLCQRTRVTHLVKVLDDIVYEDRHFPDFPFQRRVQVMWMAPKPWEEKAPHQNDVFGFDFRFRHGKVINLENVTALQEYFGQGELTAFQERVKEKLALRI